MPFTMKTLRTAEDRAHLAQLPGLGGANAWRVALETSPVPDDIALVLDAPLPDVDGEPRAEFSLATLDRLTQAWSSWYLDQGVRPHDRVAVYIEDGFEDQLQCTALAQIGAIAVLINGQLDAALAAGLIRRTDPVGVYTDEVRCTGLEALGTGALPASVRWTRTRADVGVLGDRPLADSARYRHGADDAVVICHSSGTTGDPKPVIWHHLQAAAGSRFRLGSHPEEEHAVLLSAVPQSHTSAVAFTHYAILAGLPLVASGDRSGPAVARLAAQYRPTKILAFNQTLAELSSMPLNPADFASVDEWMNVGDSAHDAHMRPLMKLGRHRVDGQWTDGSVFGDGLGSSELGWAALRRVTSPQSPPSPRCLGRRVPISEVAVLRPDGTEAGVDEVGMLGVRGPSIAPGYWNDSDTTYRSRLAGYWLSGDLVRRSADDEYFHVDRIVDKIPTDAGDGYSILMEEILLLAAPEVDDCAVVAGRHGGRIVPVAVVRRAGADPAELLGRINKALTEAAQPGLAVLDVAERAQDLPIGATGKVLKRRLREKYADLGTYLAGRSAEQTAVALPA